MRLHRQTDVAMTTYLLTIGLLLAFPWVLASVVILGSAAAALRRWFAARGDRDGFRPERFDLVLAGPPGLLPAQVRPLSDDGPRGDEAGHLVDRHGRGGQPLWGRAPLQGRAPWYPQPSRPVPGRKDHRTRGRRPPCRSDPGRSSSSPKRAAALRSASYSTDAAAWLRLHSGPGGIKPWRGEREQCRTVQQREERVLWRSRAA